MWETEGRCEVLYNYYDYLQNEFLSELLENNHLILQHENEVQEIFDSFKAIKIYSDESLENETIKNVKDCPRCQNSAVVDDDGHIGQCCKCHFVFCNYCELAYHGESACKQLCGQNFILSITYFLIFFSKH